MKRGGWSDHPWGMLVQGKKNTLAASGIYAFGLKKPGDY
jgi:hypothetical protein